MVRETRYLLVRNIPEKSTEESVNHYFQRYGKIQSVKLQPSKDSDSTLTATVAFMDIRSASKAHQSKNIIDNAVLRTDYWEATSSSSSRSQGESGRNGGSSAGSGSGGAGAGGAGNTSGFHHGSGLPSSTVSRAGSGNGGGSFTGSWTSGGNFRHGSERGAEGTRAQADTNEKERFDRSRSSPDLSTTSSTQNKKSVSMSRSASRSRSRSPRSRSGSSSSRTYSSESSKSCSKSQSHGSSQGSARPQSTIGALKSTIASEIKDPKADRHKDSDCEDKRPLGISITGLPARSSDSSLRDGLFHNYKKHGKVTSVQIASENGERYAIVSFRKPEDACKALEASQGKMFFGTKIKVAPHEGIKSDDVDIRTGDMDMDEFHPKATRTLFIGNLEKDTSVQDLLDKFGTFGDIIDVDIKRQGAASAYAFVQYTDISSVVRALHEMEGEHIGANKIKLGFGKSMPTNCVWIDSVGENLSEKTLSRVFKKYGEMTYTFIDRKKCRALVFYTNLDDAQYAVNDMKTRTINKRKVMVDFASRECQNNFLDKMEKSGQLRPENRPDERGLHKFRQRSFEMEGFTEESRSRYPTPWNRSGRGGRGRFAEGSFSDEFSPARRNSRQSSDFNQSGSFYKSVDDYELELREYGHSQRERRERGHSPRRDEFDDRSRRSSREVSLDRYDGKDRLDYPRSSSPGSEHNSFRSERFVTRTVEDKTFRDKFDKEKSEDKVLDRLGGDTSLELRGRRSPVFVSAGRGSMSGVDEDMGSLTPPTPTQEEEPIYRTFYPRSKDDQDFTPTFAVIDKPKLKSVWVSQAAGVNASSSPSISSKLGSEVTLPEKSSVRKRVHEDSVLSKDSSGKKKSEKYENVGSLSLKLTPAERQRQERKQTRQLGGSKGLGKPAKSDTKLRRKVLEGTLSSPGSSGSHPESENGSVSEADMLNLQRKKQLLLDKLDKLSQQEDGVPSADNTEDDACGVRGSKYSGFELDNVASVEELMKIDSKQGCRKQMEQIAKMEMRLKEKHREKLLALQAAEGRTGCGDLDFKITVPTDSSMVDTGSSVSDSKRRKLDLADAGSDLSSSVSKHLYKGGELRPPTKDSRSVLDVSGGGVTPVEISRSGVFGSKLTDGTSKPVKSVGESGGSLQNKGPSSTGYTSSSKQSSSSSRPEKAKGGSKPFLPSASALHTQEKSSYSPKFGPSPEACFSPTVSEEPPDLESNNSESLTEKSSPKHLSPLSDWPQQSALSPCSKELSDDDLGQLDSKHEPGLQSLAHVDGSDSLSDTSDDEKGKINEPSLEERIRMVDEIMNKTPDVTLLNPNPAGGPAALTLPSNMSASLYSKYRIRKRGDSQSVGQDGLGLERKSEPSMIMQQLLSKPSILDQDFQRLGREKYEPPTTVGVNFAGRPGTSLLSKLPVKDMSSLQQMGLPGQPLPSAVDGLGIPALVHPPVTTATASVHFPTTTTTMTMAGQHMTVVTTALLHPAHRSPVSSLSGNPHSGASSPRHFQAVPNIPTSHPLPVLSGSRSPCATASASPVVVSSSPQLSTAEPPTLDAVGSVASLDRSHVTPTNGEQDSLRVPSSHESKSQQLSLSSLSSVSSNPVAHGHSTEDHAVVMNQSSTSRYPNGSRSPRMMETLSVNVHSPAAATTPSISPISKKESFMNPHSDLHTSSRPSPGTGKIVDTIQTAQSLTVPGKAIVAGSQVDEQAKTNPGVLSSARTGDKDTGRHRDSVFQGMGELEMSKAPITPAPRSTPFISQSSLMQSSTTHSTAMSTSTPAASMSVTCAVTTSTASSSTGRSRGDGERQNKSTKSASHGRALDQGVKHDPLFAPDIKPEPPAPKSTLDTKPALPKEKEKKELDSNEKRSQSQSESVVKTEPEAKEKKHSKSSSSSSSSHSDRKVSKSRDSTLDKTEKKDNEVKQESGSNQRSLEKSRADLGPKAKSKDADPHIKTKDSDTHVRNKENTSHNKNRESDSACKAKEVNESHTKSRDTESTTKNKDVDSHSKSKEKKADNRGKSGERDGDSHGKTESREMDYSSKPTSSDVHAKSKDRDHHSQGKNLDRETDSHSKSKDRDSDATSKNKESNLHSKVKEWESHNKNKNKHKEDTKKDSRDHSVESEARSKSRDHSMETDSKSKSKEKHHDSHKKDKEKKTSPEKKTPEKTEISTKEEKKAHNKSEEKEKRPAENLDKDKVRQKEKHDTKPDNPKMEPKHEKPKGTDHQHDTKKEKSSSKSIDKSAGNQREQKSHTKEEHKHTDSSSKSSSKQPKDKDNKDSKPSKSKEAEKPMKGVNKTKNQDSDKKKEKEKKEELEKKKKQEQKDKEKQEKEKERAKEKASKKKEPEPSKRRKPVDDDDDFPYHLLDDEPVYTSMYDTIKRRSCTKQTQMKEVSEDTRIKLNKLKSSRGSTKKTKSSRSFLDDSSSDESDPNLLSLESDSQDSDSDSHSTRGKSKKKTQQQQQSSAKKKRPFVLSSSSDDEDEEDEAALLRMSKSMPKSSQEKKFRQIFNSSSSEDDLDRESSPERPPPKTKAPAKQPEKKSKPKKPTKKRKSTEESNVDSDIPDLQPAVKLDSKASCHLASLSEISMAEDTMDEIDKKDVTPVKKTKKKKKDEKQTPKKIDEVPAKKPKLSDSRESLAENKEKKSEKKEKVVEKKVAKKEEKKEERKMPVIIGEKMETSSEDRELSKTMEPAKNENKKKKKKDSKFNLKDLTLEPSTVSASESLPKMMPEAHPALKEEEETPTVKKKKKKKDKKEEIERSQSSSDKQESKAFESKQLSLSTPSLEEGMPKLKEMKKEENVVKGPESGKEKKKKKNADGKATDTSLIEFETSKTTTPKKPNMNKKDLNLSVASDTQTFPSVAATPDSKKEVKQEKGREKKEKKSKAKLSQTAQEKSEKPDSGTPALSKDIHREPILQMLAEDMQREEKKLKDKGDRSKNKQTDDNKESSLAEDTTKPKAKKKKKKEEKEVSDLGSPSFSISSLVAETETLKQPEPTPEPDPEPEDPFVSFWGHPAPVLHKKRDSIPKVDDVKDKDDKEKKPGKSGDSPVSGGEGGKTSSDDRKSTGSSASTDVKPAEVKKPAWDMSVFAFDQEPTTASAPPPVVDQEPKPLIDIPEDAFKPAADETAEKTDADLASAEKSKGQKKKQKKKKDKTERKGSKEIDPLAGVEAAIKDDTVLILQDVIDKAVFPERQFSYEDEISIPKDSSPFFSETRMRDGQSALLKSPPHGKVDSQKQIDSKIAEAMPDPSYLESENDIGVFTPFTKETRREKVMSTPSSEKPASVLQEPPQEKAKQDQGEASLCQLERDEIAMQEASDEAARAVECLLGFEDNHQYSFDNNDNLQVPSIHPGAAGIVDTGTTLSSPPTVDSVALQSQPNTSGPEIHEASEAPQASTQPDVQEQSLSVLQQHEQEAEAKVESTDTSKKGQRRGKRQTRSKGSKDTPQKGEALQPIQQQDMPGIEVKGLFPGQSPPYPLPGETHLPSMPDISKLEGSELKRNPIDAYDFDAQMIEDEPGTDLIVESALNSQSSDEQAQTMKSPRRRNSSRGGRGRRGRGGTIRDALEKVGKPEQPPPSPAIDQMLPAPAPVPPQAPTIPVWQQEIVKGDLASPDSKTDLDSSYGEAELVINLDDQGTPTDGEERAGKGQYQFGSDTEDKSPVHQPLAAAASSPYKAGRSTRTRKLPNYKAMDQGLGMNSPSPRASRSGSSPRGARGGQSPKNASNSRGRGSPKTTEFGSPIVKLDRLEVGRGKKKDESGQKLRPGGKDSEGIDDVMHTSFEDWKAANMSIDQKPVSKENIYDFADSEQEQKLEPSPVLRGPRGRSKRPSDGADPNLGKSLEPTPAVTAAPILQAAHTHLPAVPLAFKEQLQEEQAQASDDSSSSMSNVDKIIDAVSKGFFESADRKPQEETTCRPASKGRGGRNTQGPKHIPVEPEAKVESVAAGPPLVNKPGDFMIPVSAQDEPTTAPAAPAAPVHPKAGKAKQEMQVGMLFTGDLPPGMPRGMSSGFTPSSAPPDLAALSQLSKAGSVVKPEPAAVTTMSWQSVITTTTSPSIPSKPLVQHTDVPHSTSTSLSGSTPQPLPPPPHSAPDIIGRMKDKGLFPQTTSHEQHPPPASTAVLNHHQQALMAGMMAMRGRDEASPLAQIAFMSSMSGMPPLSHAEHSRRSGVFAIREPPSSLAMASGPMSSRGGSHEPRYTSPKLSSAPVDVVTTGQQVITTSSTAHNKLASHAAGSMPPVPALIQTPHTQPSPKLPHTLAKGWVGSGPLGAGQPPVSHAPPSPSQVSPTSAIQSQTPQSAQLPVMAHDLNPAPLPLKRPPSAHSSQPALHGGSRDSRPGRPSSHHSDMRPPSLPSELLPPDLAVKGPPGQDRREREHERDRERERDQIIQEQLARHSAIVAAAQRQGLPPGFMMVASEHGPMAIAHNMQPPHHIQHELAKASIPSSSAGLPTTATVTSPSPSHQHGGRRGSAAEPVSSKVPAATSASTLYTGVVAGQPRSLSPKTTSPVGQVIERLPNPMRPMESVPGGRGPSVAHRPPAPAVHQEPPMHPRYHKDENPLRTMQPPAAHGEGRAHEMLMIQMLEQQRLQHFLMAHARNAQDLARTTEAAARTVAGQEASRVAAAQEAARSSAVTKEAVARKEVAAAWNAHEAAERSLQEAGMVGRGGPEGAHKAGPLGRAQLPGMPPIPASAASVQQVPLNLADSDSRSSSSESRDRSSSGGKPSQSPFNQPPTGYIERERGGKPGDRAPPESPHLAGGAFVPPPSGGPPGAHRDGLPPPLYGNELFHPPFGMGVARMPLDPRLYAGQQHPPPPHPPFLPGRESVLASPFQQAVVASGQRFPLDQHPEAERLIKKGELPHAGVLHMRSPSPIPSPSPRGLPPEMSGHPMRVEIPVREHLSAVLGRYQMVWQGMLALKNDHSIVQMHFVSGSRDLPDQALPQPVIGGAALPLRISQRMRLEPPNLEGVTKRMINEKDYSLLLAVPCGHDHMDISEQTRNLTVGFIEYLRSKLAAGIVNVSHPGTQQPAFVVHVFPPCDFSMEVVARHSTGLVEQIHDLAHVIIIITTV